MFKYVSVEGIVNSDSLTTSKGDVDRSKLEYFWCWWWRWWCWLCWWCECWCCWSDSFEISSLQGKDNCKGDKDWWRGEWGEWCIAPKLEDINSSGGDPDDAKDEPNNDNVGDGEMAADVWTFFSCPTGSPERKGVKLTASDVFLPIEYKYKNTIIKIKITIIWSDSKLTLVSNLFNR